MRSGRLGAAGGGAMPSQRSIWAGVIAAVVAAFASVGLLTLLRVEVEAALVAAITASVCTATIFACEGQRKKACRD